MAETMEEYFFEIRCVWSQNVEKVFGWVKGNSLYIGAAQPLLSFCQEVPPWENYLIKFHTPIIYQEKEPPTLGVDFSS